MYASLGFLLAIFGGFTQLAILASAAMLICYLGIVLATLQLRKKFPGGEKTFKVPGKFIIPLLASCVIMWLLSHLSKTELTGIAIFIIVLSAVYFGVKLIPAKKEL